MTNLTVRSERWEKFCNRIFLWANFIANFSSQIIEQEKDLRAANAQIETVEDNEENEDETTLEPDQELGLHAIKAATAAVHDQSLTPSTSSAGTEEFKIRQADMINNLKIVEDFSAASQSARIEPFKVKISNDHLLACSYESIPGLYRNFG